MKLPLSLAKNLQLLVNSNVLPYSQFNKNLVDKFIEDGVLELIILKTKKSVRLNNTDYLNNYLLNKYSISDLSAYINTLSDENSQRADFSLASGDTKIKSGNVFIGFLINAYDDIYGTLNEQEISLKPAYGSFIFINEHNNFKIPEDITVIVVENFENFKYIELQKNIFPIEKKLFAWRFQNNGLSEWLSELPNKYIHFGDFDLSGLAIYLSYKQKRNNLNSEFLIPDNIENLIERYGHRERYFKQIDSTKNIDFSIHPEIFELSQIINKLQKSLEQEIFIKLMA